MELSTAVLTWELVSSMFSHSFIKLVVPQAAWEPSAAAASSTGFQSYLPLNYIAAADTCV